MKVANAVKIAATKDTNPKTLTIKAAQKTLVSCRCRTGIVR